MSLLKRLALAAVLSCLSEGAIAQQAQPATPSTHAESWWMSDFRAEDMPAAYFEERVAIPKGIGVRIEAIL